jgi:hypothetical protein
MATLPSSPTVDAIYKTYEVEDGKAAPRMYLGASELGKECRRALWFGFRKCMKPAHEGRLLRLFQTGHREEERMKADLRAIGVTVDGEQFAVTFADGHGGGHLDGAVLGLPEAPKPWHVLECKTYSKKRFDEMLKKGPPAEHVAQMQLYMGETGMERAAYFAHCKDDDRLHLERLEYDPEAHKALLLKAKSIVYAEAPPDGVSQDPGFWLCRFCDYNELCYAGRVPDVSCRTCVHATPEKGGKWTCYRELPMTDHRCPEHLFIPAFFGCPVNGSPEWIEYEDWINVGASGFPAVDKPHQTSLHKWAGMPMTPDEYEACRGRKPGEAVGLVKEVLGGTIESVT